MSNGHWLLHLTHRTLATLQIWTPPYTSALFLQRIAPTAPLYTWDKRYAKLTWKSYHGANPCQLLVQLDIDISIWYEASFFFSEKGRPIPLINDSLPAHGGRPLPMGWVNWLKYVIHQAKYQAHGFILNTMNKCDTEGKVGNIQRCASVH